tara:strand:+ start:3087 stop:3488 length:402 start_codon:yes stop_codon:yes gene_type:complete
MSDFESMNLVGECVNITIPQGSTETFELIYKDENGNPIDLDGSLVKWMAKEDKSFDTYIIEASSNETTGSYITILDQAVAANLGKFILIIVGSDTQDLQFNKGFPHGFLRIDSNGEPDQLFGGTLKLSYTTPR